MPAVEAPFVRPPYPPDLAAAARDLLAHTLRDLPFAGVLVGTLMHRYPAHAGQCRAAAELLGATAPEVFLATISYDLAAGLGCSTAAVATDYGPVLLRNMDWPNEAAIARAACVTETDAGWSAMAVGSVGVVTGLSKNGFALALNAVLTSRRDLDGYPVLFFLRKVLDEAADYHQAVAMLADERLMSSCVVTVVGTENGQRVAVERLPDRAELRYPEGDEPLVTTNHFCTLNRPEPCGRRDRLLSLAAGLGRDPSLEELLEALTDARVVQTITAQHVVAQPASGTLRMYVPQELL